MGISLTYSSIHGSFTVSIVGALDARDGLDLILPLWPSSWSRRTHRQALSKPHQLWGLREQRPDSAGPGEVSE